MEMMIFLFGLCVGSFINMAVYRLAIKYGLKRAVFARATTSQRSYCDYCGKQLRWSLNIPVISWLLLGGKSRCCKKKLPLSYPIVELVTGILFGITYYVLPARIATQSVAGGRITDYLFGFLIIGLLVFLAVFDLKYMILPDGANIGLIIISLLMLIGKSDWLTYVVTGIGSGLFFLILNRIKIRGSEAMGMGDVIYALFMGLFLGFPGAIIAFYVAFIVGAVVSLILLAAKIVKRETPIPFGPFLILGTVVAKVIKFL